MARLEKLATLKEYAVERETWTGNSIARWTNWSVCNANARAKTCRRLSTSIWEGGTRLFCETKPRNYLISIAGSGPQGAEPIPAEARKLVPGDS